MYFRKIELHDYPTIRYSTVITILKWLFWLFRDQHIKYYRRILVDLGLVKNVIRKVFQSLTFSEHHFRWLFLFIFTASSESNPKEKTHIGLADNSIKFQCNQFINHLKTLKFH